MLVFETTFLVLAFANAFGYALVASRARGFVANPRALRIVNRTGGGLLIGAGVATVTLAGRNA
jgi:threonine/homoserine/homoserine lactone efflux protein